MRHVRLNVTSHVSCFKAPPSRGRAAHSAASDDVFFNSCLLLLLVLLVLVLLLLLLVLVLLLLSKTNELKGFCLPSVCVC